MIISMPLSLVVGKKSYVLSLNNYHNWHYQVRNKLKKQYQELAIEKLSGSLFKNEIIIDFCLYRKDKRKGDRANPLSIHEKFFCDAMVKAGCIEDDNDTVIRSQHYYTGEFDKDNPRVEITIREV